MSNRTRLINDLSSLVGKHANWLHGRDFVYCCAVVADGLFPQDELGLSEEELDAFLGDLLELRASMGGR